MQDDVKKALEWLRKLRDGARNVWEPNHPTRRQRFLDVSPAEVEAILAHIDGEPARLAAAREEQREVDYGATLAAGRAFIDMMMPSEPFGAADFSRFESCAKFTRSPLTATPLADRIAKLEATLRLERDLFRETFFTPADKRAEAERERADKAEARLVEIREALGLSEPDQEEVPAINLLKVKLSSAVDVVRSLVASATPNPADHPAMSLAWSAARGFLAIAKVKP